MCCGRICHVVFSETESNKSLDDEYDQIISKIPYILENSEKPLEKESEENCETSDHS